VKAIGTIAAVIFGSALYLSFLGLLLMSLPFNVLAVMHLWGWEWWSALIGILIFGFIPGIGQLGYIVLTFMGAYYLYQADFRWYDAAYPRAEIFKVADFPERFIADRANFTQSITALGEASDLTQPPSNNSGEAFTIPKATEERIYYKIKEGTALNEKIGDAFLDYLHPDLKYYYRDKLIAGNKIYYEGIKANQNGDVSLGVQKQIQGVELIDEWNNWWQSHNKDLADKAFPTSRRH
jgi:hypothetical protein